MNHTAHPAIDSFVADVTEIVSRDDSEREVTGAVARRLQALLDEGCTFLPETYTRAAGDRYVIYPLYVAPDASFSIASAVWNVDQVTPIHDHGTWGVIGIYSGVEHEARYLPPSRPGMEAPTYLDEREIAAGQVVVCCTSDQDVHEVSCASDVPCVGIHVYGADIGTIERRAFDKSTGEIRMFVSAWADPVEVAPVGLDVA
jgi:predicted metal-dependent enzyme (double-stranded beta helix superfamily)